MTTAPPRAPEAPALDASGWQLFQLQLTSAPPLSRGGTASVRPASATPDAHELRLGIATDAAADPVMAALHRRCEAAAQRWRARLYEGQAQFLASSKRYAEFARLYRQDAAAWSKELAAGKAASAARLRFNGAIVAGDEQAEAEHRAAELAARREEAEARQRRDLLQPLLEQARKAAQQELAAAMGPLRRRLIAEAQAELQAAAGAFLPVLLGPELAALFEARAALGALAVGTGQAEHKLIEDLGRLPFPR